MTQREAMAVLESGCNVFLTGPAGSGKTHLLNEFIADQKKKGKVVAVTASTGIAATHLDGITIHSWSGIGISGELSQEDIKQIVRVPRLTKRFKKTDVLIVDEISMLHHFRLNSVSELLRVGRASWLPFGGVQVVVCGDFFQLPPVSRSDEPPAQFAYRAASWKNADFKICYLEEQFRQSDGLMNRVLNDIRERRVSSETKDILLARYRKPILGVAKPTFLFPLNEAVDAVNERELAEIDGEVQTYTMTSRGKAKAVQTLKRSCLAPEVLSLKLGAKVLFVKNNFEAGYVNGTTGEIVGTEDGYPVVQTKTGARIRAYPLEWKWEDGEKMIASVSQVPLRLAWAITVHKSQGMSLDAAETDLSKTFVPGMGYVALSRLRTLDGLSLLGMNDLALEVSDEVYAVDQEMRAASAAFKTTFVERKTETATERKTEPAAQSKTEPVQETSTSGPFAVLRKMLPGAYQKWNREEEVKLAAQFRSGISVKELSQSHGRSHGGIRARLRKLGLIE
jgi:hypothetical protein